MRHSHTRWIEYRPPPPEPVKMPAGIEFSMILLLLMALGFAGIAGFCLAQPLGQKQHQWRLSAPFSTGPTTDVR